MFLQSIWSNLTDMLSFVDPMLNRNINGATTFWEDFVGASTTAFNNAYESLTAQVCISHFVTQLSTITTYGLEIARNVTKAISDTIYSGQFNYLVEVLNVERHRAEAWFRFSDFQYRLLREFSLILAGNIILVFAAWKVYGPRISARFLARSTSGGSHKRIEELRTSMSELQLPKELDFKYK